MDKTFDEYLAVEISDDKLFAFLKFIVVNDSFKCSLEQLKDFLKSKGVVYGVHNDKCLAFVKEPELFFYDKVTIAAGDKPLDGDDGIINYTYELDQKIKTLELMEDGTVNYKQVINLNNVNKGQLIAEKIMPKEGTEGKAVTGEVLFGKRGKELNFKIGKNVVTDAERMKLYSTLDGLVTRTERDKINVFPIYEVNSNVDYHIGNIDFVGTVVIRGNVLTGFTVKAVGDIRVIGGVEGAELIAGGSIYITEGVLAHNKGSIKAGKNVEISFIQDGNVEAGEDVIVNQSIMHSNIRAGKSVICQGSNGLIVGGIIQAGEYVSARTLGNSMSTATIVEVGVLPHLRNELIELRNKIKIDSENLNNSEKALTLLNQLASAGQLNADKMELRSRLNNTKRISQQEIKEMKERVFEIEKSLENTGSASVDVTGNVYGGIKIVIGHYTKYIKDTVQRCSFHIYEGDVCMTSKL